VAVCCVFTAWLTLIFSVLFSIGSFLAGAAAAATAARATSAAARYQPTPTAPTVPGMPGSTGIPELGSDELGALGGGAMGGGALGGLGPAAGMGDMMGFLQAFIPGLCFASGAFTLVTGIVGFILFLGVAQACYALLDLEDQSFQMSQTLNTIVARLGSGQPLR
jgi:hypothetical protein